MHFLGQSSLRPSAESVANNQHPNYRIGIDPRPPRRAVKRSEMTTHVAEVEKLIDGPPEVIQWNMILDRNRLEQSALRILHRPISNAVAAMN